MCANHLSGETSRYLLQHAHNPVDWYPWGEEALNKARAEDKPIFLSIGYSACHWCHVMAHESFEDEAVAAILNAHFVSIKVDREERPDLDRIYMAAVQAMTGSGGWPMSVFLLPDSRPFYGGTYYPPQPRYGMPAFSQLLRAIAEAWQTRRAELESSGQQITEVVTQNATGGPGHRGPLSELTLQRAVEGISAGFDEQYAGWGSGPKFPQPMLIEFLLRYAHRTGDERALQMATRTLDAMARGGLYDQLGGGFHRYAVDAIWLVPHFEKMLYDNAQLARVYLHAWQMTDEPLFRAIAEETLDYVLREMTDPARGFYATQDADSEGEEGKFFLWDAHEVADILGDEAATFMWVYGVTP
ncbi:MAG: thioredoxin domain-containing protein, partial [Anaerolineae bacterium]|nr:thioredoxin domain-containing protein [Anaerolineae bacterium]